jgi:hypothetical protein
VVPAALTPKRAVPAEPGEALSRTSRPSRSLW